MFDSCVTQHARETRNVCAVVNTIASRCPRISERVLANRAKIEVSAFLSPTAISAISPHQSTTSRAVLRPAPGRKPDCAGARAVTGRTQAGPDHLHCQLLRRAAPDRAGEEIMRR